MSQKHRQIMGRITKGALYLLIAELAMSLVFLASNDALKLEMLRWLGASSDSVWREGKVWTLASSVFLQPQFIALLFHGFILWMFVPTLERWWGTKRFLKFVLWTSLAGTVAGTLAGLVTGRVALIGGLDPFIYASIIAYGILYATQPVQFFGVLPMTGRQLMIGIIVFVFLVVAFGRRWELGASYAAAMGVAWLLVSGKWTPKLWYLRRKQKRLRRHLRLVRDDDDPKTWMN